MNKSDLIGHAELFIVALIWGATFVAAKSVLAVLNPVSLAFARFLISSILFLPIIFRERKKGNSIEKGDIKTIIILGLLGVTFFYVFQFLGLEYTSATNVSLLIALIPIFTTGLSTRILKENTNPKKLMGLILSLLGVGLVITNGKLNISTRTNDLIGAGFILINVLCWSVYTVIGKKILKKYPSKTITAHSVLWGTALMIPLALIWGDVSEIVNLTFIHLLSLLYLGILGSFVAYLLWYDGLKKVNASTASSFLYFQPLVTIVVAHFWLGDEITPYIIIGGILIISGVYFVAGHRP